MIEHTEVHGASNTEVRGASNTEVHGASNTEVHGASNTEVRGASNTEVHVASNTEVHGASNTEVHGASNTEVHGARNAEVHGARNAEVHGARNAEVHGARNAEVHGASNTEVRGARNAECSICHMKFHYENYLKLHVVVVHEGRYQIQCTHCDEVLCSKTGLIAHINQFHPDTIQLYPCPKCGRRFRRKSSMKTHLISHTKDRAYRFDYCNKAFKYPDQLNRHQLEHTQSQKYSCMLCDKQFVRTYQLRNHIRNYHIGYVYVCDVCHEYCAHRHTIINHYKCKHPEVGNVFEEKPEFIDSLQKPVTAVSHSQRMFEPEDGIIVTAENGSRACSSREMILRQMEDQTSQIQQEDGSTIMGDDSEQMEMIQEINFDPQQLAELQSHGESVVTKLEPDALEMSETVENIVQQSQAVVSAMKAITSERAAMEGMQVVEMSETVENIVQ